VLQGVREAVQEGREPLVAAKVENTAALHRVVDTFRQDLTYTTISIVHSAAPTPPSQGNGRPSVLGGAEVQHCTTLSFGSPLATGSHFFVVLVISCQAATVILGIAQIPGGSLQSWEFSSLPSLSPLRGVDICYIFE
jgi:hypothetical protein